MSLSVGPIAVWLLVQVDTNIERWALCHRLCRSEIAHFRRVARKERRGPRFTRTLGTLIAAGVPILEAINITRETSGNEVFVRALANVHDSIREGESFANPLRASKVVDGIVVNMVDVGEETGELDKMLLKVADNYDEEVDVMVAGLVSLLEPIMVIALGGMVGFIVVALFMPLVSLIDSVSG